MSGFERCQGENIDAVFASVGDAVFSDDDSKRLGRIVHELLRRLHKLPSRRFDIVRIVFDFERAPGRIRELQYAPNVDR